MFVVWVCVRERDTHRDRERGRETEKESWGERAHVAVCSVLVNVSPSSVCFFFNGR